MSSGPILVLAGGTGGHVYPALAVAEVLQRESHDIVWLGTRAGLESRIVPAAGIRMEWISVSGLRGKGVIAAIFAPFRLLLALTQSLRLMIRHRPAVVLGMGGFASGPGGLAAWMLRRPLVIHEQNAIAGLTNRLLARLARVVLQAFPGSFSASVNAETVGNPVRAAITALEDPELRYAGREGPLHLLILGGSLGALALNRIVPAALALLPDDLQPVVWHQAGERTLEEARSAYQAHDIEVQLQPFIEDMAEAYAWADLVVCRAGALTVAELSAAGLPAIFVPYPFAVDDHQTANTRPMTDVGAAALLPENELSDKSLACLLKNWLKSRDELLARARKSRALAHPDALRRIASCCMEAAGTTT